jgi:hypothetical protein
MFAALLVAVDISSAGICYFFGYLWQAGPARDETANKFFDGSHFTSIAESSEERGVAGREDPLSSKSCSNSEGVSSARPPSGS